jgi:hypothetical protein
MHTKVAHFLSHIAHFCKVPFLNIYIMNNKTYQIENWLYINNLIMQICT